MITKVSTRRGLTLALFHSRVIARAGHAQRYAEKKKRPERQ